MIHALAQCRKSLLSAVSHDFPKRCHLLILSCIHSFYVYTIRECDSILCVGMAQGIIYLLTIGAVYIIL